MEDFPAVLRREFCPLPSSGAERTPAARRIREAFIEFARGALLLVEAEIDMPPGRELSSREAQRQMCESPAAIHRAQQKGPVLRKRKGPGAEEIEPLCFEKGGVPPPGG